VGHSGESSRHPVGHSGESSGHLWVTVEQVADAFEKS
jgi:hypothetical protein